MSRPRLIKLVTPGVVAGGFFIKGSCLLIAIFAIKSIGDNAINFAGFNTTNTLYHIL